MITESDILRAIERSISHNEIVRCHATFLTSGLRAVSQMADIDGYVGLDCLKSDRRYLDIWGTFEKSQFRLNLFEQN